MRIFIITVLALGMVGAAFANEVGRLPWYKVLDPSDDKPRAIGGYAGGCLAGAVPISQEGVGYKLPRADRGRVYGHPALESFIQAYGQKIHDSGLGVVNVSDLGQPRGGPPPAGSSHKSHQNGLDVDIWYQLSRNGQAVRPYSVLTKGKRRLHPKHWSAANVNMLKAAADFDEVARIFVHPAVKRGLCRVHEGEGWLRKIRPWWGHHTHFHVRLRCPEGSPECENQSPIPNGDGCDASLAWWFSDDARKSLKNASKKPKKEPDLPQACQVVYKQQAAVN